MNRIKSTLRKPLEMLMPGTLPVLMVLSFVPMLLGGCITRPQIRASLFLHTAVDPVLCEKEPRLKDMGIYRRLNDGRFEFISYCDPRISRFLNINDDDLEKILDELLPETPTQSQ